MVAPFIFGINKLLLSMSGHPIGAKAHVFLILPTEITLALGKVGGRFIDKIFCCMIVPIHQSNIISIKEFQKMHVSIYLTTIGMLALFIGCGTNGSKKSEITPVTTYDGVWLKECALDKRSELYSKSQVTLAGTSKVLVDNTYSETDSSCSKPLYTLTYSADFTIGNDVSKVRGSKEIDERITRISLVMYNDSVASTFNKRGLCGYKNWKAGVSRDLSKNECAYFFDPTYNIIKVDGNKIFFGFKTDELSGVSPSKRPTELESTFMTRQ